MIRQRSSPAGQLTRSFVMPRRDTFAVRPTVTRGAARSGWPPTVPGPSVPPAPPVDGVPTGLSSGSLPGVGPGSGPGPAGVTVNDQLTGCGSGLPAASSTPATVAVYSPPATSGADGVSVAVRPAAAYVTDA